MWEIVTGSRLHFGLFQPGLVSPGQRRFGGVGMMIDKPGLRVRASPAPESGADGSRWAARIAGVLQECRYGWESNPRRFSVEAAAPEHAGLGTGTQLSLAVAKLQAVSTGHGEVDIETLAIQASRGRRSGIGTHGFVQGGLLVDGGPGPTGALAPLIVRMTVPRQWRIVLAIPSGGRDWYGERERHGFDQLDATDQGLTDRLCRLTLLGLLPALAEHDLDSFGEALFELNAKAGALFAGPQGGVYAGPQVAAVVNFLRGLGVKGVGQSSWGPTVFGVVGDEDRASFVADQLRRQPTLQDGQVIVSAPLNEGARVVDLTVSGAYNRDR